MDHWAAIEKETGEHHFVIVNAGSHPSQEGGDAERYRFVKLTRAPGEHDKFDGKRIKQCAVTKARCEHSARLDRMTRAELVSFIEEMLDVRLREHGLIPAK